LSYFLLLKNSNVLQVITHRFAITTAEWEFRLDVSKVWARSVVPNLFLCIPPLAHFGTFHSSPITQFQQRGWKGWNVVFAMTPIARCGLKYDPSGVVASFQ